MIGQTESNGDIVDDRSTLDKINEAERITPTPQEEDSNLVCPNNKPDPPNPIEPEGSGLRSIST